MERILKMWSKEKGLFSSLQRKKKVPLSKLQPSVQFPPVQQKVSAYPMPKVSTQIIELKYDLEPHDRELAPLCRGFESQLKLKQTRANDEKYASIFQLVFFSNNSFSSMEEAASGEEASPSKVSGEMRGSRGSTPDVPVESKNSSADLNLAPPPKKSKAKALPSSDLPPETMAKLREVGLTDFIQVK